MASYQIIHTENLSNADKESIRLAAARALYIELLKYYNAKMATERSS